MDQNKKSLTISDKSQAGSYISSLGRDAPENILSYVDELIKRSGDKIGILSEVDLDFAKVSTLNEFNNGTLMAESIPDKYRTFAIGFLRRLVNDYNCQTVGEKATAELVVINHIRVLDLQERMTDLFICQEAVSYSHDPQPKDYFYKELAGRCTACERSGVLFKWIALLSKDLDRANKHFLASIQTLRLMKQAPLQVNINTNIGQNQVIQNKNG